MATKAASKVPTKNELYDLNGQMNNDMFCCGLVEYDGVGNLRTVQDALNIRYAAYHTNENRGFVLATGIKKEHTKQMRLLTAAGFKKMKTFKNPRSGNTVVLYGATTLKGKLAGSNKDDEEDYDFFGATHYW